MLKNSGRNRAVNTLILGYKDQSVNAIEINNYGWF